MKKILFVSTSNLDSNNYSGDAIRALNIINYLRKKNIVDSVSLSNDRVLYTKKNLNIKKNKNYYFKKYNFFLRLYYAIISLLKFKPLQLGFFYSKELEKFIKINHKNYDTIIFHLTRGGQYLPKNFKGNKILEMTDLMSNNYIQTRNNLSLFNPLFYLYSLEAILIKKYEKYCLNIFNKIILVSKKDLKKNLNVNRKLKFISNGVLLNKKIYKHTQTNYKIIFIGNINYLPNKLACLNFAKNILPLLNKQNPEIKFHIIGEISSINKLSFYFFKNVKFLGKINNLDKVLSYSICGISNLKIATGIQNKILTYASYGLPILSSMQSSKGIQHLIPKKDFIIFEGNQDLVEKLIFLKKNKSLSEKLSNNSYAKINKLIWNNTLKKYSKII